MQLSTAYNIHNRGSFQASDTALKSGDSHKDRQSGGETYMPFQQGDQVRFQPAYTSWQSDSYQPTTMRSLIEGLFNLDIRLITSIMASLMFTIVFQTLTNNSLLNLVMTPVFFVTWYIMSYFNFQRVLENAQNGPRQTRHMHHQVSATF